jgi:hypothetical protein
MLVFSYFDGDDNENLKDMQYEMYSYAISTIFEEVQQMYLYNSFSILYLSEEEIRKADEITRYDHRMIQTAHDVIAAVFRFRAQEGIFEKGLFEEDNDQIKESYRWIYRDTNFLENILHNYLHYTVKWWTFIIDTVKRNIPLVRELVLATRLKCNDDSGEGAWEAAARAGDIIKEKHGEIPWL